jgi:hypothetical protein
MSESFIVKSDKARTVLCQSQHHIGAADEQTGDLYRCLLYKPAEASLLELFAALGMHARFVSLDFLASGKGVYLPEKLSWHAMAQATTCRIYPVAYQSIDSP